MKDYQIYNIGSENINQSKLIDYVNLSVDKFNHLYGGMDHATKYYYLYNFFSIASCNYDVYQLYLSLVDCIRHYFNFYEIEKNQVWIQSWMNVHKQDEVLKSHSHAYPYHGYITLTNQNTHTVFTDDYEGEELYRIVNFPLQIYIGPGYRHHHVSVMKPFDGERITLGFDIEINNTISDNFSFIPITL